MVGFLSIIRQNSHNGRHINIGSNNEEILSF